MGRQYCTPALETVEKEYVHVSCMGNFWILHTCHQLAVDTLQCDSAGVGQRVVDLRARKGWSLDSMAFQNELQEELSGSHL
jgi:hypothetical protein